MATSDKVSQPAKPTPHKDTHPQQKVQYEHPEILDNRLTWEVLEDGEEQ